MGMFDALRWKLDFTLARNAFVRRWEGKGMLLAVTAPLDDPREDIAAPTATGGASLAAIALLAATCSWSCVAQAPSRGVGEAGASNGVVVKPGLSGTPQYHGAAKVPAELLDLSRWKLTLPVDTERPGLPDEIRQPELASFADHRYFLVDPTRKAVIFRAPCGGTPTRGSSYPRCELREMNDTGRTEAAWETDGNTVHVMTMGAAVTATPAVKKHVVVAQIHDAADDVLMIRLEATTFIIEREGLPDVVLEATYVRGTPFALKIAAGEGRIMVWWNGQKTLDWVVSRKHCYFKAGCYTQSNLTKGDAAEAFGEVAINELRIESRDSSTR